MLIWAVSMDQVFADQVLSQIADDYDAIAEHFAQTRQKPWAEFSVVQSLLPPGGQLLDVGCGNGRLAAVVQPWQVNYVGLDVSAGLLAVAREQFPTAEFIQGSMLALPFPDNRFAVVTAIASLQHIPSVVYRLQALRELYRVTLPDGYLFMMNWNLAQPNLQHYLVQNDDRFDPGDALVPWKNAAGAIKAQRYYHSFTIEELAILCAQASWDMIEQYYSTQGQRADQTTGHNLVTIVQKK